MKNVMIVDDNCLTAEGIEKNIDWSALDATVIAVEYNSLSALDILKDTHVDLIISDIEMPDLDGISMSQKALEIQPFIKVILVSAYDKFEYAKRAIRLCVFVKWLTQLCASVCEKMDSSLQNYHNQIYTMALGYIRENFETNTLCLNDIARHANISPAYLSSLFKKVSGQSISDTITALRIESACHYLESTSLSLKEISTKCGYTNQYYFSNSFKKKLGMSPSAYREARGTQGQ